MEFTLLGTGSAIPSPERLQSGLLLDASGDPFLLDCGSGVTHRLRQAGYDHEAVSTVLLTHHHLDHVADLPTLFKARILTDHPEFTVVGPPGTEALCDRLFALDELHDRGELEVRELASEEGPYEVGGFDVTAVETSHTEESLAYRFGDALTLSGDTTPDPAVFDLADGVHTLVHECSFPTSMGFDTHTTPDGLVEGLQEVAIDRLVVTHLFPSAEQEVSAIEATLNDGIDAEVAIGTDGMQGTIPD